MTNRIFAVWVCLMAMSFSQAQAGTMPLIAAHRGASHDAPENTLASMRLGLEQGADAIEGDFYLTADGKIICIHDANTKRTTGEASNLDVSKSTLAELRNVDAGSWKDPKYAGEKLPTLEEMLKILPTGKMMLLEIKCGTEILPEFFRVIKASGVPFSQLRVICFKAEVIAAVKEQYPEMKCYWLTGFKAAKTIGGVTPTAQNMLETLKRIKADGLDAQADFKALTPEFIQQLRKEGYEFHAWTVDKPEDAKKLVELGVDSITTNRPAFIREILSSK